ncbi:MAG: SAM-dependent methyltransferase [Thiotrichales bacterium SG8_50]|jgi:SAM-dependent methyltransferase|nr:MAG: SAM-dependent methyltransferase [Thiotrichales bacterium SG8_50]
MGFKDYFSEQAADYASYRPHYPASLFTWLADICPQRRRVWDCATGSGQAAAALKTNFAQVIATDASHAQLIQAQPQTGINYVCARAEQIPLASGSLDLITVAQAIHWFDRPRFYDEVHRLLVPNGMLALWCYGLFQITPAVDSLIQDYYQHTVGEYWPPERHHVEQGYDSIDFPYVELTTPEFNMQAEWNLQRVMGYLATWSATRHYIKATGKDPLPALAQYLTDTWGDPQQARVIQWPLHLKVGNKPI